MPTATVPARKVDPAVLDAASLDDALRRELYFFSLYRVLEAALLALILFSPAGVLVGSPRHPPLGQLTTLLYVLASLVLLVWAQRRQGWRAQVMVGTAIDIVAATLAMHALPMASPGIALMLLFNIGAAALLLPLRYGLGAAALAAGAMMGEMVWSTLRDQDTARPLAERLMFSVSFLAIAMLTYLLGRQMRSSQALAERRGAQVADLAEINELIIRRMRTGVVVVDGDGRLGGQHLQRRPALARQPGPKSSRGSSPMTFRIRSSRIPRACSCRATMASRARFESARCPVMAAGYVAPGRSPARDGDGATRASRRRRAGGAGLQRKRMGRARETVSYARRPAAPTITPGLAGKSAASRPGAIRR